MTRLLLVDGNSIINRAYYAVIGRAPMTAPDGTPTGAVNGFFNSILGIANNSWGYVFETEEQAAQTALEFEQNEWSLKTAINYFIKNAGTDADGNQTGPMRGGLVTFAAGNEGWAYDVPGQYEPVVAVGAFGPDGKIADYSSHGPWV